MEPRVRDARVRTQTLYWVDCTVCGADGPVPAPRFTSEAELWKSLIAPDERGWVYRDDGRILCPHHRDVSECQIHGHQLTRWTRHPTDDDLTWRFCSQMR
jgi:hypothetical protein